jgi:hypothetical protein
MPGFGNGFNRGMNQVADGIETAVQLAFLGFIIVVFGGLLASSGIPTLVNLNSFYSGLLTVVELAGIISTIGIILAMPEWGTLYMLGWIVAFAFAWYFGLATGIDMLTYVAPSLIVLVLRFYNDSESYSGGFLTR